ncbi:glycosyltransferase [Flavobacterium sp. CHNK8]|uniref:glycosyltransferase family 2 protein n=1 Tax=Flavobacterium sp. CHNK8 TaxID=2871165 RepID=UPI001C8D6144|nr:glycosyltransferase [Flavobacterium sp. CHNK8]QZK89622.1 glycosyltransferase [Flavobacterium sp. CHNK8]
MNFTVSVVIPAYNVAAFVSKAVFSALQQTEVFEVLIVDDGSTDETLKLALNLQKMDSRVKVFQHDKGKNLGRSASRNLGIQRATGNYIAFLDADDFYLEKRFENDKRIFQGALKCDGVYNAVGFSFYRPATATEQVKYVLCTVSKRIPPSELFAGIVSSKYGLLHLNGLTVLKSVFDETGLFNQELVVAEDSDIIFKMALKCVLEPGIIDRPVAKRGIHENNIFDKENVYQTYTIKLYESLFFWSYTAQITVDKKDLILKWLWFFKFRQGNSLFRNCVYWCTLVTRERQFLLSKLSIKYFPIIRYRQMLFPFLFK